MTQTLPKLAADFETTLNAQVSVGDTTASLTSVEDTAGVDLPAGTYAFTIDGDNQYKEYIVCSLSGTTLTDIVSISPQGASSTGFSTYHRRGASVVISDWAALSRIMNNLDGTTGFNAAAPLGYDGTATISSPTMFATKKYVDDTVSGGTVTFDTQVLSNQTAGENLTAGNAIYFKTSDQRWYKTDADAAATATGVKLGIAVSTVTTGNSFQVIISGVYTTSGLTAGSTYYLSGTAGAITTTAPSAPSLIVVIGIALSATKLFVAPFPTEAQFAGVGAQPSSTNKFLDQASSSVGSTDQSQTTQNATSIVGASDLTGQRVKLAQSFIPSKTIIKSINLNKQANTGTFTGTVTVSIQADSAGNPSGVALATKTITNAFYNAYSTGDFLALFSAEVSVTPGNTYWIVIECSTNDNSNHPNIGTNSAGGYSSGSAKYNNTTDGWVAISTIDLYFKVNEGFNGKEILASSTGYVPGPVRKTAIKVGSVQATTSGAVIAHGFGYLPSLIRAANGDSDSSHLAFSVGAYDVANGTYAAAYAAYNEATSGASGVDTNHVVMAGPTNNLQVTLLVDENIVVFISSSGTPTIQYEIIG